MFSADTGMYFTFMEFQNEYQNSSVRLVLAAPEYQEMNRQVKVIWRMLRNIAHSLMVHARVSEAYIYFAFMYTADHISLYYQSKT